MIYVAIGYISEQEHRHFPATIIIFMLFYLLPAFLVNYGLAGEDFLFVSIVSPVLFFIGMTVYKTYRE